MQPIKTANSNGVYKGNPEQGVADLPVEIHVSDDGYQQAVYSVWQLTPDERQMVAQGANIRLGIISSTAIPPVGLGVTGETSHDDLPDATRFIPEPAPNADQAHEEHVAEVTAAIVEEIQQQRGKDAAEEAVEEELPDDPGLEGDVGQNGGRPHLEPVAEPEE